ncbi:ADL369Cp [Eremothecium gossypii ATCC 10895]|uniref:Mannose 6-phosphate receptor-like protein 1 n=1 Tax=Eremothecium gossypii (strain ATCC 10895 / CBS 109.51 / FGSC 9923 / NRRL Y-1056) TaxID=284811 RepID=MRL1_EREGS|nr:ADL369Cp [Eremothecium gossypii ATCC 10895]Q75BD5.1 RecName: Full=Mannose 6-phosphate receptor-like protein 1; Flags: Precursor [Eremothecium gossypii ATCC 10895]AAS51551.1 ADL369Cp [Eremothecium gossypii ATCC 10895]AEY95847.1 FADL369Cp [Eremothecium gossypii FDAG1]
MPTQLQRPLARLLALALLVLLARAAEDEPPFCAVRNRSTGSYIDLSPLASNVSGTPPNWLVRGWQYGANFTLGVCTSPLGDGPAAYYSDTGRRVSIGRVATTPRYTGKKLTLTYEGGDLCPNRVDRKSSLLYFVCDRDIHTIAQVSLLGVLHNCSYLFEVRSVHACAAARAAGDRSVLGIFAAILLVFAAVELARRCCAAPLRRRFRPDFPADRPRWAPAPTGWAARTRAFFARAAEPRQAIKLASSPPGHPASDMEAQNTLLDSLDVRSSGA